MTVAQLVNKITSVTELRGSLLCPHKPRNGTVSAFKTFGIFVLANKKLSRVLMQVTPGHPRAAFSPQPLAWKHVVVLSTQSRRNRQAKWGGMNLWASTLVSC